MIVHFICRGNVFRSRIAEAYLNSLEIPGVRAISSGALAEKYAINNIDTEKYTIRFLTKHGLGSFTKQHWDQLNDARVRKADVTICMTQQVVEECKNIAKLLQNVTVWSVEDVGEDDSPPLSDEEIARGYKQTFQNIKKNIDELVRSSTFV